MARSRRASVRPTEGKERSTRRRGTTPEEAPPARGTIALRIAQDMGLLAGPKGMHVNAKVPPQLFEAAARRIGTTSPAAVISAALASLATEDAVGPWLAGHWGTLSDLAQEVLDQIER